MICENYDKKNRWHNVVIAVIRIQCNTLTHHRKVGKKVFGPVLNP